MHRFRDNAGREWLVVVNSWTIKRVRGLLDLDLLSLVEDGFSGLGKFLADPIQLVDTLYVICKSEVDERGVTEQQFFEAMAGDAIQAASDAFLAEYTDFFQNPRVRAGITGVIEKARQVTELMMAEATRRLDAIDVQSEARRLVGSSGASPGSSDSTPDPSPSASSS